VVIFFIDRFGSKVESEPICLLSAPSSSDVDARVCLADILGTAGLTDRSLRVTMVDEVVIDDAERDFRYRPIISQFIMVSSA
jgi:hypothetical protein